MKFFFYLEALHFFLVVVMSNKLKLSVLLMLMNFYTSFSNAE